jgi:hypothetical protein
LGIALASIDIDEDVIDKIGIDENCRPLYRHPRICDQ